MNYDIQRSFMPGSEWVYIKIYCSSTSSNKILTNQVYRITTHLANNNKLKKWFFIRYMDPYYHLRLRILLTHPENLATTMGQIHKNFNPLIKDGIISKIQLDTYNREIERYGEDLIELTESFFHIDSIYALKFFKSKKRYNENEDFIILSSILFIDNFLSTLEFTVHQRMLLLKQLETSFWSEFHIDRAGARFINDLYRKYNSDIHNVLINNGNLWGNEMKINLSKKEKALKPLIVKMAAIKKNNQNQLPIDSFIHMMINRLICSRNRSYELIVYSFLHNFYRSVNSRYRNHPQ